MIHGIGTDIVAVARLQRMWERHGEHAVIRLLAPDELPAFSRATDKGRFLAKRFAAKEAFAKAFGTGLRAPAMLGAIAVVNDDLGKPALSFHGDLDRALRARRLTAHLSISDEADYAVAFVVLEKT
jgi:holo-[acyl-carrier protein] synthase